MTTVGRNKPIRFQADEKKYFDVELRGNELVIRGMDGTISVIPDCSNVVRLRIMSPFVLDRLADE